MLMVPKATEGQFDVNGSERLLRDNLMFMVPKATAWFRRLLRDDLMLMVPKATETI